MNRSLPIPAKNIRRGVTLVELLVVMGLIGFLASMVTYALLGAQNDARTARTRGTITKLNDIILTQWEEYRYRPVDMRRDSFVSTVPAQPLPQPRTHAFLRMLILRDIMRMEMPDRVSDLLFAPTQYTVRSGTPQAGSYLAERVYPHKFGLLYSALYRAVYSSTNPDLIALRSTYPLQSPETLAVTGVAIIPIPQSHFIGVAEAQLEEATRAWNRQIQSSELLYLVIANSNFGGTPALEYFRPSEIGDPDGDGLLEFVDAWGSPIAWIRWPAGYPSDLNRYANTDALDPLRTDWRYSDSTWPEEAKPQTLVPLIVSAGPDEQFGIIFDHDDFYQSGETPGASFPIIYARMVRGFGEPNQLYIDPFFTWDYQLRRPNGPNSSQPFPATHVQGYRANQLGAVPNLLPDNSANTFATDNITNHDIILGP